MFETLAISGSKKQTERSGQPCLKRVPRSITRRGEGSCVVISSPINQKLQKSRSILFSFMQESL